MGKDSPAGASEGKAGRVSTARRWHGNEDGTGTGGMVAGSTGVGGTAHIDFTVVGSSLAGCAGAEMQPGGRTDERSLEIQVSGRWCLMGMASAREESHGGWAADLAGEGGGGVDWWNEDDFTGEGGKGDDWWCRVWNRGGGGGQWQPVVMCEERLISEGWGAGHGSCNGDGVPTVRTWD